MLQEKTESYITLYKEPEDFRNRQLSVFWTADEIKVEKDVHDVLTNFTEAERHGVFTTLKLFTHYEMKAGEEYWTGRFMKMFPRHEFTSMASVFGMFELAVHAPFYNKINLLLNAHDDSFYTDYVNNHVLKARMDSIDSYINHPDDRISIAAFSLVEGVILYSNFAFLKHFQSLGKNKLLNVVRGIDFSVRDENIHSEAGAWCFNELPKSSLVDRYIRDVAREICEHETSIIYMLFAKGDIEGINPQDMITFVKSRIDVCLLKLGIDPIYEDIGNNPIADWFYKGINNYKMNDFFTGQGREYTRNWDEKGFVWK